jgi:hypothetical protein
VSKNQGKRGFWCNRSALLAISSKFSPKSSVAALQNEGIDLDELMRLSQNPEIRGTLVEVEDHQKNEKIVIALE